MGNLKRYLEYEKKVLDKRKRNRLLNRPVKSVKKTIKKAKKYSNENFIKAIGNPYKV